MKLVREFKGLTDKKRPKIGDKFGDFRRKKLPKMTRISFQKLSLALFLILNKTKRF